MKFFARASLALMISSFSSVGHPSDDVPEEFRRLIVHRVDSRSISEKALNAVNLTNRDVGRGFAIIAGVSRYPNLPAANMNLDPAEQDMRKLVAYLRDVELFDEVILLKNEDMSYENLRYFLQVYMPERLKTSPKSRFLFAYSGHGTYDGYDGYLLESRATSMTDRIHAIDLRQIRDFFPQIVRNGHQVLVLLNACYSGAFLQRSFGQAGPLEPRLPGAHAITAGGTNEPTWHDPVVGSGSVFFEKFFAGLSGIADTYPVNPNGTRGDGIVTVSELATYLQEEIRISSDQKQNPQLGDISINGPEGGGVFFLSRRTQVARGLAKPWDATKSFGEPSTARARTDLSKPQVTGPSGGVDTQSNSVRRESVVARKEGTVPTAEIGSEAISFAVAPFDGPMPADNDFDIAQVIGHDLQSTGRIHVLGREKMPAKPSFDGALASAVWRRAGVSYLIVGRVAPLQGNQYALDFKLLNAASGDLVTSNRFVGTSQALRNASHRVGDAIFERLFGHRGVFSTRLAYVAVEDRSGTPYQLILADADGENQRLVLESKRQIASPRWSPDGNWLAYVSFENDKPEVYVQYVATGERRRIPLGEHSAGDVTWSPDGTTLALTLTDSAHHTDIYTEELKTGKLRRITDGRATYAEPEWGTDGNTLYFSSNADNSNAKQIYSVILRRLAYKPELITKTGTYNARPRLNADGSILAMVTHENDGFQIAVQNLATGRRQILTHGDRDQAPSFAPNGDTILYSERGAAVGAQLVMVSVSGTRGLVLRAQTADIREAAWGPFDPP